MGLPRESALSVKCSLCGNQVEISMMGDHLCSGPTAELSPPPDSKEQFDDNFRKPSYDAMYGRTPPRVNTSAANRHFMDRGQLTPVSQPSESRNASPVAGRPGQSPTDAFFSRSPPQSQRPGGYGGLGRAARGASQESASAKQGGGLFGRINAIAPVPFNTGSRPPSGRSAFPARKDSLEIWDGPSAEDLARTIDRPGTGYSNLSGGSYTITIAPPKAPRKNGYGGFGPPSTSTNTSEPRSPAATSRSETYPQPSVPKTEPLRRQESAPGSRTERSPMYGQLDERQKPLGPDRSRKPPPRTSLLGRRTPRDSGSVDLAAEFGVGNPYHTPSDSASSTFSDASHSTALTSLTQSQTSRDKDDYAGVPMESLRSRDGAMHAPPRPVLTMESPYGGALEKGSRKDLLLPSTAYNASASRGAEPRHPDRRNDPYQEGPLAADRRGPDLARTGPREAMRSPSRGDCKACRVPIKGKSISSADGRLTGKYHKACFVCATCMEPFKSAEFYVLNDKPYCEQHYHKLNGSLCGGCGRGIEGQYLEDEARIKYHVGCFRCLDCGLSLPDGYFEVDGKAFCERHAWKRTQRLPPLPGSVYDQESQRLGAGSRPQYGAAVGSVPGRRPGRSGSRSTSTGRAGSPPLPGSRPRPKMNKRMTRLGRM